MKFIPFKNIDQFDKVIAVDCHHPRAYTLSHWKGAEVNDEYRDDTSTGIVLRALECGFNTDDYEGTTNNHFDIDGFLGVWSIFHPKKSLRNKELLRVMAVIGDFREFDPYDELHDQALKFCCWINSVEKKLFYPPFGTVLTEEKEAQSCVTKYEYFIEKFGEVLSDTESFEEEWGKEYEQVKNGLRVIQDKGKITDWEHIKLHVVESPEPLHYYALFHASDKADIVLSIYDNNRYELEYKYTSWIDTWHRKSFPRIELQPLADQFNQLEENVHQWDVQKITDTAPVLRLDGKILNKVERYDHPVNRPILSSSIAPKTLLGLVVDYFEEKLHQAESKENYSWKEIRSYNKKVFG